MGKMYGAVAALTIVIVALIVGLVVVRNDASSSASSLRRELSAVKRQEAAVRAQLSGGSGASQSVTARVAKLDSQLSKLRQCVPELQTEVNGLTIDTTGGTASISNSQQISSFCQGVLYGPGRMGG